MSKFNLGNTVYIKEGERFGVINSIELDGSISVTTFDDTTWYCDEDDLDFAVMVNGEWHVAGDGYDVVINVGDFVYSYNYNLSGTVTSISDDESSVTIQPKDGEEIKTDIDDVSIFTDYISNETNRRFHFGDTVSCYGQNGIIWKLRPYGYVDINIDGGTILRAPEKLVSSTSTLSAILDSGDTKNIIDPTKEEADNDIFIVTMDGTDSSFGAEIYLIGVFDSENTANCVAEATKERIWKDHNIKVYTEVVPVKRNHAYDTFMSNMGIIGTEKYLGGYTE